MFRFQVKVRNKNDFNKCRRTTIGDNRALASIVVRRQTAFANVVQVSTLNKLNNIY